MNLNDYSEKDKIITQVASLPETTTIIYAIGSYDIEFDLELRNTSEYHKIINNLRNKFSTIREIKSIRAVEYYIKEHKFE